MTQYLGSRDWDGPKRLSEMYAEADPALLGRAPEYRLNLVVPALMSDEDFSRFHTGLGLVLKYVKHSGSKEKLRRAVNGDSRFTVLDLESAELVSALTGSELEIGRHERDGVVNMCKAIDDMRRESWDAGRLAVLADLVRAGLITDEAAAEQMGVTPERFRSDAAERGFALV